MSRIQVVKRSVAPRTVPCVASPPTPTRARVNPSQVPSDWFDRMFEETWELHHRIQEERHRLRTRVSEVEHGETITRINLERKLPREVWTLLLWDEWGDESYEEFRDLLGSEKTLALRKWVSFDRDEQYNYAELIGRRGRYIGLVDADRLLWEEDRAVFAWTLLLAGVSSGEAGRLVQSSLPPKR